jgi:hypothetical protein
MDHLIHIFKLSKEEAKKIAESPDEPHNHDFEELIVGMEGELEHFIDFKSEKFVSPFVSFVTKGKVHRVIPVIKDDKFSIWVIEFKSEFMPETTFQLYSYYHDHSNLQLQTGEKFNRMITLCEMMHSEAQENTPDFAAMLRGASLHHQIIETKYHN